MYAGKGVECETVAYKYHPRGDDKTRAYVWLDSDGWYCSYGYWDMNGGPCLGPFKTRATAAKHARKYVTGG